MRKALCVGINYYKHIPCLTASVNDAANIQDELLFNEDFSLNFDTKLLCARNPDEEITRRDLRNALTWLFEGEPEVSLFYFSGHGAYDIIGSYLCTSDVQRPYDGISMESLLQFAKTSKAKDKIIILDCCFSGSLGNSFINHGIAHIPSNTTILAACGHDESAMERGSEDEHAQGIFTSLLIDSLRGTAKNIFGEITPIDIYTYIVQGIFHKDQHPVFKANSNRPICLKKYKPLKNDVSDEQMIKHIANLFNSPTEEFPLDPTYEEDKHFTDNKVRNKDNEDVFRILRNLASLDLVEPVGEEYMYWAAIHSKTCRLTPLGQIYWHLSKTGAF